MDDRRVPHGDVPIPVRTCEISRLQGQLLAQAYLRICPEIRQAIGGSEPQASSVKTNGIQATAVLAADKAITISLGISGSPSPCHSLSRRIFSRASRSNSTRTADAIARAGAEQSISCKACWPADAAVMRTMASR